MGNGAVGTCSKERKKELFIDLMIITVVTFLVLIAVLFLWGSQMNHFAYDQSIHIVLRVLVIGVGGQFGIAGLGISIVCILRKERFSSFGLHTKNLVPALLLSLACCVPDFIYCLINGKVHVWCPFWDVNTTPEVLASSFPYKYWVC